jgi:drug/metabolite transporter (DMT)-like permease
MTEPGPVAVVQPAPSPHAWTVWLFAAGYLAGYAPYSTLTKLLTEGHLPALGPPLTGTALLPMSTLAATALAMALLVGSGWWRKATPQHLGRFSFHGPSRWTALSGACSAVIMLTTTLAYTFDGSSILFMMLLMRGGVLAIAPVVDFVSGRKVKGTSWAALALSGAALVVTLNPSGSLHLGAPAAVDIALYLGAYFVRLQLMSRLAKRTDADNLRYFVEEQMVTSPVALASLGLLSLLPGAVGSELRRGFVEVPVGPLVGWVVALGLLSQSNGLFGGLVLLDHRENSFAVPVNRAASILAGLVASYALVFIAGERAPQARELVGTALIVLAVLCLARRPHTSPAPGAAP